MKLFLKVLVSAILLGLIFYKLDWSELASNIKLLDLRFVPLILTLLILNYVLSSVRWKALLIHNNSKDVSVGYLTKLYFVGAFFNNFMPTSIGGDVYKVYRLGKKINSTADAFSATFMERFTGVLALVTIAAFSLIKLYGALGILAIFGLFFGTISGFYFLKFMQTKNGKFKKLYDSMLVYKDSRGVLA
ncbi:flippase-like domain-containing protein, partial [Patescibacteria group bacterium]|nr:flippase-like domain-containing protein [Patescibacteria group bacterium]